MLTSTFALDRSNPFHERAAERLANEQVGWVVTVAADGTPQPFVQSNAHAVFIVFDTATGEVTSYSADVTAGESPVVLDRFTIG